MPAAAAAAAAARREAGTRAWRSGVGGRGPSLPLARPSFPSRSPLLGATMADRLPGLTSAPSLPDLPLSTLTSALTSRFLPRLPPPAWAPPPRATSPEPGAPRRPLRACATRRARLRGCARPLPEALPPLPSALPREYRARVERRRRDTGPHSRSRGLSGQKWARAGGAATGDCSRGGPEAE